MISTLELQINVSVTGIKSLMLLSTNKKQNQTSKFSLLGIPLLDFIITPIYKQKYLDINL